MMPSDPAPPKSDGSLNPRLHQEVDKEFADTQHGSAPMETVSVKNNGPAVWPVIWAVVTLGLIVLTLYLVFG